MTDGFSILLTPIAFPMLTVGGAGLGEFPINMPSNPPLVGVDLFFQAIVVTDPFTGSWTNVLATTIQPDN